MTFYFKCLLQLYASGWEDDHNISELRLVQDFGSEDTPETDRAARLRCATPMVWRSEPTSCLQQVTYAFADCLAGPWTPVPWWMLLIVYLLGMATSGICKRRLQRVAVAQMAKLKAVDQRRSGIPKIEAKKKVDMAASALDFHDGPGAKKFLYEALSLIDS